MNDINQKILQTMKQHNDEEYVTEEQANALQLIGRSFKGTFRITAVLVITMQLIFAGLAIYCGYQMYNTIELNAKLHWIVGTLITFVIFALLRMWLFMELNRLSVLREIKRVELQLALLNKQSD